jgi:signal peptide peptidase SppA
VSKTIAPHSAQAWAIAARAFSDIGVAMRWRAQNPAEAVAIERQAAEAVQAARQGRDRGRVAGAVAVLPLRGVITPRTSFMSYLFGGMGLVDFMDEFRAALSDDDVGSILIDIDSPGGRVDLVPEAAEEIRAARGKKPIVAVANTMACSAAYWLGAMADELVVTPSGQVGSVGTYILHEDWSGMNEQIGIDPTFIVSSASPYKVDGNPEEPLSEDARATWQQDVDDITADFFKSLAKARNTTVKDVRDNYGQGRVLNAKRAMDAGMVDNVQTYDQVVARLVGGGVTPGRSASATTVTLSVDGAALAAEIAATLKAEAPAPPAEAETSPNPAPSPPDDDTHEPAAEGSEPEPITAALAPWLVMPTPAPTPTR